MDYLSLAAEWKKGKVANIFNNTSKILRSPFHINDSDCLKKFM